MDELYDDLENYDDVNTVNQLKTENSELKHKLGECNKIIEMLQKDLDKLTAEFKALASSYSSLLKSARAEIQRKTEMITNLNIQKDMLIITAAEKAPANKIQKIVRNAQMEAKRKKKKKRNVAGEGPKDRTEFIRRECERPPSSEASSTATDSSNKMMGNDRLMDDTKTRDNNKNIRDTQENEAHEREVFPNYRGEGNRSPVAVDRRVSALACHQPPKLSSDEEFEDMYSALKPNTEREREPERNRKRGRDDSEDSNTFYNNTHDRPLNYADPFRERFNRNRTGRYSKYDRNLNRDKQYNESNRNMNRDAQYDSNKNDKYDSHYHRYSPERHRRGAKEHPDDRHTQQRDKNRRLVSPPRERNQHRSRERRKSCHDRERQEYNQDAHRSNYQAPHTVRHHIHGEYDEPQKKRPRLDPPYPMHQEDRRLFEKQFSNEMSSLRVTCQSPEFSHEESANEPIPVIRSTASSVLDDPRVTSKKYVLTTEGSKEVLQAANANKIHLQPVNKSLWNLQEVQVPNALKHKPSDICEELVDEMETDKPLSIISMESGEVGSETTDTVTDDVFDFHEVNKSNYNNGSRKLEKHYRHQTPIKNKPRDIGYKREPFEKHKETSLIENTPKDIGYKSDVLEKHRKSNSPIETTSKEIGYKSDSLEKHNKETSLIENTPKDIVYKSDVLEKHRKAKSPIETTSKEKGYKSDSLEKHHKETSLIENTPKDIGYKSDVLEKHRKPKSPIETTSKEIGYKSDSCEKHHKETSLIENTPKDIGYKSDVLEKHRKSKSPIEKTFKEIGYKSDSLEKHHKEKSSVNKSKNIGYKSDILEKGRREKSPILKTSRDISHERDGLEKEPKTRSKLVKSEKTNNRGADISSKTSPTDNNEFGTNKNNEKPTILKRLIDSVVVKSPEQIGFIKSSKSKEENERKETDESRRMEKTEQLALNTVEHKEDKKSPEPEKENETSLPIFREFEHRVCSTRHIVEGDLELSDDSNDEKQLKIDEKKIEVKAKQRTRRKSTRDTCKEKPVDVEDTTRKTRSKKDKKEKEDNTTNKFSELFGDSSSLITPEDLNLATRAAHALPAEACPPAHEDAQDGIIVSKESVQTLTSKVTKGNSDGSTIKEDKRKAKVTKDNKTSLHKRNKSSNSLSDDTHKAPDSKLNEIKKNILNSTETPSVTEVKLVLPNETLKQIQNSKINTDTNKNDALNPNEKPKGSVKINKRHKNKDEKRLSISEPVEESNTKKTCVLEANSNITLASDNKENSRGNDNSEGNINSEMARIFENTVSNVSKVNNEKPPLHDSAKDHHTISSTVVQDVPNLAPVSDEPGLVKTVVISTGIQLLDSNSTQYDTTFNALASSTPAKELSIINNSSEIEPNISHTAQVSVTIERDDTVSQSENDAPDIRINYTRRRRKVLKR